ncbi:hypothetical protein HJFPF1_00784 [Paramyrothecium foliicola]|nr:hypothetical protein HJFPF1_00784 [Paramyrothecium foliicola]
MPSASHLPQDSGPDAGALLATREVPLLSRNKQASKQAIEIRLVGLRAEKEDPAARRAQNLWLACFFFFFRFLHPGVCCHQHQTLCSSIQCQSRGYRESTMQQPILLLGLAATAAAWVKRSATEESWTPAQETSLAEMHREQVAMGWSPRPTEAPKALMGRMLMPRMDDYTLGPETCGFVSSNGNGATCTYSSSHVGCCVPNEPCNIIKTTCIDYDASSAGSCNLPDDFHTLCWYGIHKASSTVFGLTGLCSSASTLGACFTWVVSTTGTGNEPDATFSLLDCASRSGTATLLDYDPAWARTHVSRSASSTSEAEGASSTDPAESDTPTQGPTSGDENSDGESDNAGSGGKSKGSSTNVAAIAGGAAGGAVGLAIIAATIFFCLRRKKKNAAAQSAAQTSPPQPMIQTAQSPPPSTFPPSSPGAYSSGVPASFQSYPQPGQAGYDPHASIYSQQGYNQQYPPQQQFQGHYAPQHPGFPQGQSPQHFVPAGYQPPSTVSPPPLTTPSPGVKDGPEVQTNVNELQAVNPVGHESNRAELGGPQ